MWELFIFFNKPDGFPQSFLPVLSTRRSDDILLSHNYSGSKISLEHTLQVTGTLPHVYSSEFIDDLQLLSFLEIIPLTYHNKMPDGPEIFLLSLLTSRNLEILENQGYYQPVAHS